MVTSILKLVTSDNGKLDQTGSVLRNWFSRQISWPNPSYVCSLSVYSRIILLDLLSLQSPSCALNWFSLISIRGAPYISTAYSLNWPSTCLYVKPMKMDVGSELLRGLKDQASIRELSYAVDELNLRGLVQSASWLAELIASTVKTTLGNEAMVEDDHDLGKGQRDSYLHCVNRDSVGSKMYTVAKSYFDGRQYRRTAQHLEKVHSPHGRFLRLYAIFLAGEKRKEEERYELEDDIEPVNSELEFLRGELAMLRSNNNLDAHLYYLLGVVLKHLALADQAKEALEKSVSLFPYNWGAWLELAPLCNSRKVVLSLQIEDHWMKSIFLAYILNETDEPEEARQIYESFSEVFAHSTFFKIQIALALYNVRRFDEAQQLYDDVYADDPYCLDGADIYSNILYVKEDKVQLSLLANRCMKVDKFRLETCCVIGNYYSLRGQHDQAVLYFQRALRLNRNYLSAWTLMGHEYLEMKNTSAAVDSYRRAVDINPKDFRAWYGLGQTYELLSMPLYTLYYYQKAAALRPKDVRMWCAIGHTYEELSRQDEAIRCYERAQACDDGDGEALAKLAALYERLAHGALRDGRQHDLVAQYSERAERYYMANLARRDEEKLGGAETAAALRFLAEHNYAKNCIAQAEKFCYRLLNYPGQDKDFAKKLLRQIHSKET